MAKLSWSELSPRARAGVVALAAVEAALTTAAVRDLHGRDGSEVNGPKWVWRLAMFVQPAGPIVYLIVGRKRN